MIEFIVSILTIILFLAVVWFAIYITWGTDISGRNPSAVGTTTMLFIVILIILGIICGIIWFILNALSFV